MLRPGVGRILPKSPQRGASSAWFLLIAAAAVAFIWFTARQLPPLVGVHFGTASIATGFVPRSRYVLAAISASVLLPFVIVFPISLALRSPNVVINLPNRDYWLTPERRPQTVNFIRSQMMRFGTAMLLFICYVHWLVVEANAKSPPRLATGAFVAGIAVFACFVILWITLHYRRFRRIL
jgi:hypothetical protein